MRVITERKGENCGRVSCIDVCVLLSKVIRGIEIVCWIQQHLQTVMAWRCRCCPWDLYEARLAGASFDANVDCSAGNWYRFCSHAKIEIRQVYRHAYNRGFKRVIPDAGLNLISGGW